MPSHPPHPDDEHPFGEMRDEDIAAELQAIVDRPHPDRAAPRGNGTTDDADVDRGRAKLDRILGW